MSDYGSTGYAVSNEVQKILDRKWAMQRQALLDQLNQKNIESEIAARDENARSMAEERAAQAAARQAAAEQAEIKSWGELYGPGSDVSNLDPAILEKMRKRGLTRKEMGSQGPSVSSMQEYTDPITGEKQQMEVSDMPGVPGTTMLPDREVFAGTADQQEMERRKTAIGAIISNPKFKELDPLQKYLIIASATGNLEKGFQPPAGLFPNNEDKHSPEWYAYQDYVKEFRPDPKHPAPMSFPDFLSYKANLKESTASVRDTTFPIYDKENNLYIYHTNGGLITQPNLPQIPVPPSPATVNVPPPEVSTGSRIFKKEGENITPLEGGARISDIQLGQQTQRDQNLPAQPTSVAPTGFRRIGTAAVQQPKQVPLIDPAAFREVQSALTAAHKPNATDAAQEDVTKAVMHLTTTLRNPDGTLNQEVGQDVRDILDDPILKTKPYTDLVRDGDLTGSPTHLKYVQQVLATIRGF